jgi:hypothetical protein
MTRRSTLARIVALSLLLLTGFEIFACELAEGISCELAGAPDRADSTDDHCLCCCLHVVLAPPPELRPVSVFPFEACDDMPAGPVRALAIPERPPRF